MHAMDDGTRALQGSFVYHRRARTRVVTTPGLVSLDLSPGREATQQK